MKVQLGINGSSSSAATLVDMEFTQCADGAYVLSNKTEPGSSTQQNAFRRTTVQADLQSTKSGDVRVLLRAKVRVPLASYNVNGTVVTNVPELFIHTILTVPKVVASALLGTLTTSVNDSLDVDPAQEVAQRAVAEAVSILATLMTGQPTNYTFVRTGLQMLPLFKGILGVCPLDYANGDYGSTRVLPPPARS